MIYFDINTRQDIIDEHYDLLKSSLLSKITSSTINKELKEYIEINLKKIIKGRPHELKTLNTNFKSLKAYRSTKIIKGKISKIFDYKYFATKKNNAYDGYELAQKLNIRTCLYCNRNYTLTVAKGRRKIDKITRPEFDHFFDKSENPLLALSIQNLIPSCKTCNSSLKGSIKFNLLSHLHPYQDEVINFYSYKFVPHDVKSIIGGKSNLSVKLNISSGDMDIDRKITKSKDIFKLEDIMSAHSDELKDLFNIRYKFSERYFEELFNKYKSLGLNYNDVYKVVFGVEYNDINFSNRPFSKLKKDILQELGIIK